MVTNFIAYDCYMFLIYGTLVVPGFLSLKFQDLDLCLSLWCEYFGMIELLFLLFDIREGNYLLRKCKDVRVFIIKTTACMRYGNTCIDIIYQ